MIPISSSIWFRFPERKSLTSSPIIEVGEGASVVVATEDASSSSESKISSGGQLSSFSIWSIKFDYKTIQLLVIITKQTFEAMQHNASHLNSKWDV